MTSVNDTINERFVLDSDYRPGQQECIKAVLEAFVKGKKFFILEAPTGSGKSAVGLTVSQFFKNAYYLTIQKILQDQIGGDYEDRLPLVSLKGRANYPCDYYSRMGDKLIQLQKWSPADVQKLIEHPPSCSQGYCRTREHRYRCEACFERNETTGFTNILCPYYAKVRDTSMSKIALLNYSSFLYQTQFGQSFGPRSLMIIDEGHNIESQLMNYVSVALDSFTLNRPLPELEDAVEYLAYFEESGLIEHLEFLITQTSNLDKKETFNDLIHKIEGFKNSLLSGDDWVCDSKQAKGTTYLSLKPVYVHQYSNLFFGYAKHILIMSATILGPATMMKSLGIDPDNAVAYRMKNNFPVENRPIYYDPVCKIVGGKAKQGEWGPKLVKKTDEIIAKYPGQCGIVHTHNFSIANMLIQESKFRHRMLFQANFESKEEMVEYHKTQKDTIIVAPAMHEGLDLRDDFSRFQIICKVPWPNIIEDKQLARRVEDDYEYYQLLVAHKIVQSSGRSIRHEDDKADTYIVDETFDRFRREASHLLPTWFHEAIIEGSTCMA